MKMIVLTSTNKFIVVTDSIKQQVYGYLDLAHDYIREATAKQCARVMMRAPYDGSVRELVIDTLIKDNYKIQIVKPEDNSTLVMTNYDTLIIEW